MVDKITLGKRRKQFVRWKLSSRGQQWIEAQYRKQKKKCKVCRGYMKRAMIGMGIEKIKRAWPDFLNLSISIDHIVPLSEGGENKPSNYRLIHHKCNYLISIVKDKEELRKHYGIYV